MAVWGAVICGWPLRKKALFHHVQNLTPLTDLTTQFAFGAVAFPPVISNIRDVAPRPGYLVAVLVHSIEEPARHQQLDQSRSASSSASNISGSAPRSDMRLRTTSTSPSLGNALTLAADANHGLAIRLFLQRLVNDRHPDEEKLKEKIAMLMEKFREKANVDQNDGSACRVADSFGSVFAAGELARQYGILPKFAKPGLAALTCYKLHLAKGDISTEFDNELQKATERADIVDLGRSVSAAKIIAEHPNALGYVRGRKSGDELWVNPDKIKLLFPQWEQQKTRPDVRNRMRREGTHLTVKRPIGPGGKQERVFCFRLPRR